MLQATANWLAANAKFEKQLVYRIVFPENPYGPGYGRTFSMVPNTIENTYPGAELDDPWVVSIDDHVKNINDLDGGADQETFSFTVQDRDFKITADMGAGTVFEGMLVQVYIGFASLTNLDDYLLYWQGYIDTVDSTNSNLDYIFQCSDVTVKLQQVVYLTGDDGAQTSAGNVKTVQGHPLDIMLDILLNQVKDPATGQGLDPSLINTTKIKAYRDGVFAGMSFLFHIQQPPSAADFIKNQILKPLGGYMWVSQGMITVNFFYPLALPTPLITMGPDNFMTIPTAEQTEMVNVVQFQFDKDDDGANSSGQLLSTNTQAYTPSVLKYGVFGEHNIVSDGLRAALQGYLITWLVSQLIFLRYGLKNLMFDQNAAEGLFTSLLYEPGDVIAVTHPQIPDRKAGVMGITGMLFEITNKKTVFDAGTVTLSMIDASYLTNYGLSEITPDNEPDYTSAPSGDQSLYMFLAGSNGKYSDGNPGNKLG